MTESETIVFDRLAERSRDLAELYESALRMIADEGYPARSYHIGLACREIRNALPDLFGAESEREIKIADGIAARWRTRVSQQLTVVADDPAEQIAIPRDIAEYIEGIVQQRQRFQGRQQRRFGAMCDGINPSTLRGFTDPSLAAKWVEARPDDFVHVPREQSVVARDAQASIAVFRVIEGVLATLFAPASVAIPFIDELLREANES